MEGSLAREHEIRLQHERILGHLNFGPLRIYPDLFKGFDSSFLKFEICELAKRHHVPYSLRNNKCDFPFFFLIHTDIWVLLGSRVCQEQGGLLISLMIVLELPEFI